MTCSGHVFYAGCMSIHTIEQFTKFLDRLYKMPCHFKMAEEPGSVKSNGSAAAVTSSSEDLHSSPGATKGLELYYAKPGEAEWGC